MAEKNTFILYDQWGPMVESLPVEKAGELFQAIYPYRAGKEPSISDPAVMAIFAMISAAMYENEMKYDAVCASRSESGKLGGRPKKASASEENQTKAKKANGFSEKQSKAKKADNDNDNDMKEKDTPNGVSKEKHRHGAFSHVLLTDQEEHKLIADYGADKAKAAIDYLDEYIERKGYSSKSHYLAIRKWVFDAIREEQIKHQEMQQREQRIENFKHPMNSPAKPQQGMQRDEDLDAMLIAQISGRSSNEHMDYMPQERSAGYVPIGFGP